MAEKKLRGSKCERWNDKFSERSDELASGEPFVLKHVCLSLGSKVLDLACGDGRNAIALAEQGFDVTGVDFSQAGLARLERFARKSEVVVKTHCRDLEEEQSLTGFSGFDTVVLTRYLPGPIVLMQLASTLREGGKLVICTFNERQHLERGFKSRFCLRPNSLDVLRSNFRVDVYDRYEQAGQHLDGYVLTRLARHPSGL